MEDYAYVDEEQVRKGLTMLWIALAGSILMIPALFAPKLIWLFMMAWMASLFGALGGIREVARGTNGSPALMYLALVAAFMPLLNIAAIGLYLGVGRAALRGDLAGGGSPDRTPGTVPPPAKPATPRLAEPASPAPAPSAQAPDAEAAVAAVAWSRQRIQAGGAKAFVSSAIACIRQAGLRSAEGGDLKDGTRLGMRFKLQEGAPRPDPMSEPILRVAHGTFGVAYLVDLGDHYTWVSVGQLVEAKLTLDDLHRVGLANLARLTERLGVMEGDEAQMLAMGGDFEASLLLVDALWDKGGALAAYAPNAPVVAIPARDVCAFCDIGSPKGLDGVRQVASNPLADPKLALTPKLFTRVDGRWREFPGSAARPAELPPLEFR